MEATERMSKPFHKTSRWFLSKAIVRTIRFDSFTAGSACSLSSVLFPSGLFGKPVPVDSRAADESSVVLGGCTMGSSGGVRVAVLLPFARDSYK